MQRVLCEKVCRHFAACAYVYVTFCSYGLQDVYRDDLVFVADSPIFRVATFSLILNCVYLETLLFGNKYTYFFCFFSKNNWTLKENRTSFIVTGISFPPTIFCKCKIFATTRTKN